MPNTITRTIFPAVLLLLAGAPQAAAQGNPLVRDLWSAI